MSPLEIQYLPVSDIMLDQRNPRVAPSLEGMEGEPAQDWIELTLGLYAPDDSEKGASTTFASLKASIRANMGLINPITVKPIPGGKYLVIEGNTRVSIYRQLEKEKAPGNWKTIPAMVYGEIEDFGEHAIRLQAHLVGPRNWLPYAKAKYLHMLYVEEKYSINQILDFCGGTARKREIEELIVAYTDMQDAYMPLVGSNPPDYTRFSGFVELQKPGVKQAIMRAGYSISDFAQWVHDDGSGQAKIYPLNTIRQLPRILANPEAKKKFLSHGAREAMKILEQPSSNAVLKEASIEQLANAMAQKIRTLNWPDVQELTQSPESPRAQALVDCFNEIQDLCITTKLVNENA